MSFGYAIQCSSMRRIHERRKARRRCRGRELMNTMRAPSRCAAWSCALRPALSNITTSGRQARISSTTAAELKVADEGKSVTGNGTRAIYGASRLNRKCTAASGQRSSAALAIAAQRANSPKPYGPDTGTNKIRKPGSAKGREPAVEHQQRPRTAKFGAHRPLQHAALAKSRHRLVQHPRLGLEPAMHG